MSRFSYHQPAAFSYHVVDPEKFKFSKVPHFRPPTPPTFSPPKDPNAPEKPIEEAKPASEENSGDSSDSKPPKGHESGGKPLADVGVLLFRDLQMQSLLTIR